MKFLPQKINDLLLITPDLHRDDRGVFRRSFCEKEFKEYGINFGVKQGNISENYKKHTIRGFHYQVRPFSEDKIITCAKGEIFVVLININKKSKHYLKHLKIRLDEKLNKSLLISKNCASAFLTLKKNTLVFYYMSNFYKKRKDLGIRYNDPKLKINWPYKPKVISNRDKNFKDLN